MSCPALLTPGRIAQALAVPLGRVQYILRTRRIDPTARAGILRLYDSAALRQVEEALLEIDARMGRVAASAAVEVCDG
jgi:hypothetical protein